MQKLKETTLSLSGTSSNRTAGAGPTSNQDDAARARKSRKAAVAARLPVRRGLSEVESAIYLSLSPSFFRRLVDQRIMPRPRVVGGRRVWDVEELDVAFKALPRDGGDDESFGNSSADSWADYQ